MHACWHPYPVSWIWGRARDFVPENLVDSCLWWRPYWRTSDLFRTPERLAIQIPAFTGIFRTFQMICTNIFSIVIYFYKLLYISVNAKVCIDQKQNRITIFLVFKLIVCSRSFRFEIPYLSRNTEIQSEQKIGVNEHCTFEMKPIKICWLSWVDSLTFQ